MKTFTLSTLAVLGAVALPAAAQAQSTAATSGPELYVGASAGIHDLGIGLPNDDGKIYGVVAGVDVPLGETLFAGVEGNYHLGDGAIDNEYGVAARLGMRIGERSKVFVRGGYQEVEFDVRQLVGVNPPAGFDNSDGDYLVGAGVEFGLGDSPVTFRAAIDTIAFDSTRATVGVLFGF